jgi:hypothetical protein
MRKESAAHLTVSWGYDVTVELHVPKQGWSKIMKGEPVTIRGDDYYYEGEFFRDYWDFSGGIDGELRVRYGSSEDGDDSGEGFVGYRPRCADRVVAALYG